VAVKTYDPKEITIIFGATIVSGFADGSFVKVERTTDTWSTVAGADGEVSRSKSNDKRGTITITLQQTSLTNDIFSAYFQADELTNNGVLPVIVKNIRGIDIHTAAQAWVKKPAAVEYGKESGSREWIIETDELLTFVGGNL
jgi:hypothetical protein